MKHVFLVLLAGAGSLSADWEVRQLLEKGAATLLSPISLVSKAAFGMNKARRKAEVVDTSFPSHLERAPPSALLADERHETVANLQGDSRAVRPSSHRNRNAAKYYWREARVAEL